MIELFRMYRTAKATYEKHIGQWPEVKSVIKKKVGWNLTIALGVLIVGAIVYSRVPSLDLRFLGLVFVAIGAIRLAHVSANVHMRRFFESSNAVEAIEEMKNVDYRPRVAGNMVDALFGFLFVAMGFLIRIVTEFTV